MTRREAEREAGRLQRGGWADVRLRNMVGKRRIDWALTAVDPMTGYRAGPWWTVEEMAHR